MKKVHAIAIVLCALVFQPALAQFPGEISYHWQEILKAKGSEPTRILESTRNRLDPFFNSPNLRRMFGSRRGLFDCERFIRERKIVILDLGRYGKIPDFIIHEKKKRKILQS